MAKEFGLNRIIVEKDRQNVVSEIRKGKDYFLDWLPLIHDFICLQAECRVCDISLLPLVCYLDVNH